MISNEAYTAIESLDLEPIKFKLMHITFGEGWSESRANAIATEYRRFLYLQYLYPGEQSSPTADVDTFWHYHILDTVKYAADCDRAFGYFMHHYPYLGLLDDDAPGVDRAAADRTRELYEATFGEAYLRPAAYGLDLAASEGAQAAACTIPCIVTRPAAKPPVADRASLLRLADAVIDMDVARSNLVQTRAGRQVAKCVAPCIVTQQLTLGTGKEMRAS